MDYKYPLLYTIDTYVKYIFSVCLVIVACIQTGQVPCLIAGLMELAAIFLISNPIIRFNHILGWIVNGLLLLLFNIQMAVLTFGNTYISLVMMTNLDSVQDLAGQAFTYLSAIVAVLILSFIPARHVGTARTAEARLLALVLAAELCYTLGCGNAGSPYYAYYTLIQQSRGTQAATRSIQGSPVYTEYFHNTTCADHIDKPEGLPEQPNVILIFTEGLSQNIVTDSRKIMPNVAAYEKKSINFTNYFNHTFATYRALSGQLYSGYQLNNYDSNALPSLQSILSDAGYTTSFINTEARNMNFTNYLIEMGFDNVISDPTFESKGVADTVSDKDAYELLYNTVTEQGKSGRPFFTAIYTFGTHTSLNSPNEKFGDGKDSMLNKFYNLDCQFGEFMKKFEESDLKDNTIIFFTADHATYQDRLFNATFPDYDRQHAEVDEMPFFIYHKGVESQEIDVSGRNTLSLAPTVLDYLDISVDNYFLGMTLFAGADNNNNYDTLFTDSAIYLSTREGKVRPLSEAEQDIFDIKLQQYYAAKTQPPRIKEK